MVHNLNINYSVILREKRLDAEYFLLDFSDLEKNIKNKKLRTLGELCEFIHSGPSGSMMPASAYVDAGIKVIRPSNLNGWTGTNGELAGISEDFIAEEKIKLYRKGDILISRIGDLKFGIIEDSPNINFAISPNLFVIRTDEKLLDPYFLLAFLNSEKGFRQIFRGTKKGMMASINRHHIEGMLLPRIAIEQQRKVGKRVRDALANKRKAISLYVRAEKILLQSINFHSNEVPLLSQILNLKILQKAQRADAEYFLMSLYDKKNNTKLNNIKLGEIVQISRGIEPGRYSYRDAGKLFVRPSNIGNLGLLGKSQKYITEALFNKLRKKYQPQVGELLLVKDGKPGVAHIVNKPIEGIISDGIVRLKSNGKRSSEYIYLCINSIFCRRQIKRDADGTLAPHWKVEQIKELLIPDAPFDVRSEIVDLVKKAMRTHDLADDCLRSAQLEMERF